MCCQPVVLQSHLISYLFFYIYIDYHAQRPVLGGSETDWRAGVGWEVLTDSPQLYEGHESHNGANIISNCLNSCIFNDNIFACNDNEYVWIRANRTL